MRLITVLCFLMGTLAMANDKEFKDDFNRFLHAVKVKDQTAFNGYISDEVESFHAILPGGTVQTSVGEFLAGQDGWFNGTTGKFDYTIESYRVIEKVAIGAALVEYSNIDSNGKAFTKHLYITFIFEDLGGSWILIHDQNTIIEKENL